MKNYIPKHTSDVAAVDHLQQLPFAVVVSDVPKLLECIQDMHWDIGRGVADYLAPHVNEIVKELLPILHSGDECWKFNVIRNLLTYSSNPLDPALVEIVKSIADHPTKGEIEDNVDWAAKELTANKFLCG